MFLHKSKYGLGIPMCLQFKPTNSAQIVIHLRVVDGVVDLTAEKHPHPFRI